MAGYTCRGCDQTHDGLPFAYASPAPAHWYSLPEDERGQRSLMIDGEVCEIDDQFFFLRGSIRIPVLNTDQYFEWGVWVSLSRASYDRTVDLWDQAGREGEPPCFGWLQTALPYTPSTINLKTMVHTQPLGLRPLIELEPTDHPLAVEQREGITLHRVQEIAERMLPPH
jgi:hypothetical protein